MPPKLSRDQTLGGRCRPQPCWKPHCPSLVICSRCTPKSALRFLLSIAQSWKCGSCRASPLTCAAAAVRINASGTFVDWGQRVRRNGHQRVNAREQSSKLGNACTPSREGQAFGVAKEHL